MGFSEYAFAMKMRDIIKEIVGSEINRLRPRVQYGTVESIDRNARKCNVRFAGATDATVVSMGAVQPLYLGQVVRVAGMGGDRYIQDVMGQAAFIGIIISPD